MLVKLTSRQNRDVADNLCVSANAHLWIIDSQDEFDLVTNFYGLKKVKKKSQNEKQFFFKWS